MRNKLFSLLFVFSSPFFLIAQSPIIARGVSEVYNFNIQRQRIIPPFLEILSSSITFTDENHNLAIDANEECEISFKLKNSGLGDGLNLRLQVLVNGKKKGIEFLPLFKIPDCMQNDEITCTFPLKSNLELEDGMLQFQMSVIEPNYFNSEPVLIKIETRAFPAPNLQVADCRVTHSGDSNVITRKKPFNLELTIINKGNGQADSSFFSVLLPEDIALITGKLNGPLGNGGLLLPGDSTFLSLKLIMNDHFSWPAIPINVVLSNLYPQFNTSWRTELPVDYAYQKHSVIIIKSNNIDAK